MLKKEGSKIATNVASEHLEKGHVRAIFSLILLISFTIYIRFIISLFFHKALEVLDNIKIHIS